MSEIVEALVFGLIGFGCSFFGMQIILDFLIFNVGFPPFTRLP
jgi:hypothetical protein